MGRFTPASDGTVRCIASLFYSLFRRQPRPLPLGFVGLVPGFVEAYQLLQRVDGVGVLGAELGFAAVAALHEQELGQSCWTIHLPL